MFIGAISSKHVSIIVFITVDLFSIYIHLLYSSFICDALRDLVPFVQFKKRKRHSWRLMEERYFSRFLICTNDTKSRKASRFYINENFAIFIFLVINKNFSYSTVTINSLKTCDSNM